ncbi:MAG: TldD/PmbA family protein [Anaerolineae bacterium]
MLSLPLPPELEAIRSLMPDLVGDLERHTPYAAGLASSVGGINITVNDREQRVSEGPVRRGAVWTAWDGSALRERAVGGLAPETLAEAARELAADLPASIAGPAPEPGAARQAHFGAPVAQDPRGLSARDKLELCRRYHAKARGLDPRLVNAQVTYSETLEAKVYCSRTRLLSQSLIRIRFRVMVFASDGIQVQRDSADSDGVGGLELAQTSDEQLAEAAATAVRLLSAERIEPGFYDVVFDPNVGGVVAHEAFGHGVETDMFVKQRARAADYLGKPVGSPLVNLLDDPTLPGAYGSYWIDDEGEVAAPTHVLRNGIFERGLTDLYSAFRLGIARTANGRRESFARKAYARMSNTVFARGTTPVADLLAGLERGIYLRKAGGGMEDPKGWGLQVEAVLGEEYAGGRLTGRVFAPVGITGYVPDILSAVSAVGDDFALDGGTCGKGWKEWVPVSSGGPHLRTRARLG